MMTILAFLVGVAVGFLGCELEWRAWLRREDGKWLALAESVGDSEAVASVEEALRERS